MFATLAADYPREPRAGEPDLLDDADRRLASGEITSAEHADVMRRVVKQVLDEQQISGLGILTDGAVQHLDRLRPLIEGLGGSSSAQVVTLPDGAEVFAPRFDRPVGWRGPITVDAWRRADQASDLLVKQVLIGPYTIARLTDPAGATREGLALSLAEALNAELRALVEAGCPVIQIDEGALTTIGDDEREWGLYAETQRRLTAGLEERHLSLGIYHGAVTPAGHASILGGPYLSFLVDALGGPDAWRFVFAVPAELGVIVGALDAANPVRDETEVMVWAMAWAAHADRTTTRIGIASNGSLRAIGRHLARRKIELMGEAVRIGSQGPLQEVAEALDPTPLDSRMTPLREMAQAVEAARAAHG
jgi:5-methyltetrahydropteroyltriglutamate--homocysteine methyltransferase